QEPYPARHVLSQAVVLRQVERLWRDLIEAGTTDVADDADDVGPRIVRQRPDAFAERRAGGSPLRSREVVGDERRVTPLVIVGPLQGSPGDQRRAKRREESR